MKNEVTFEIENKRLNQLIQENQFEEAENLSTRMLSDYNKFDYELLLKRARIRQCQMKYEEAALDANLALHVLPQRIDAYYVLSEFLIALNNYSEALKLLQILYNYNPDNQMIKTQFEQIREKERKKQPKNQTKLEIKAKRQQELKKLNQEKFQKIKEFVESSPDSLFHKSQTFNQFQKGYLDDEPLILSDEMSDDNDNDISTQISSTSFKNEQPGNAQHLETPRVHQQLDFRSLNADQVFNKKKEVYRMKPEKLSIVQCQLCQLIFDYTSTCSHYSQLTQSDIDDLKEMMPGLAGPKNMDSKKQALQKVTRSLDVLSTFKVTSLTLLQGQFSEIIALYLKVNLNYNFDLYQRDLSILLGENSEFICKECCCIQIDENNNPQITLAQHALIIVNRSLTFQQQALMLNQKEDLINVGGLEEEKADFKVEPRITNAIIDEMKIELDQSQAREYKNLNFQTLQLLPSIRQILRKYEQFEKGFPQNAKLINALNGDYLWFSHSNLGCNMKNYYKDQPLKVCGGCKKSSRQLKACSRCLKVYYCNRDCQKSHYPMHKVDCVPLK
ncbi:mynd finger [Stylonychia lemnae]|uniref:Mynd finger n=1 Tax=Stylonychia lemnae TaxID=5949 RepID=A0A078B2P0_STYLE|nr:mynd finger [Stylonychia lemnae]|eukprot:CDW87758.1 mynd finger [Stylonychia lemnae]